MSHGDDERLRLRQSAGRSSLPASRNLSSDIASSQIRDGMKIERLLTIQRFTVQGCVYGLQEP
jgi:hypothetical protein